MLRRRLKSNGEPENVPMYPYEITTRLSDLSLLDFSFQTIDKATVNDFDNNEIVRLRNLIQRSNGDDTLLDLDDKELEKALCLVKEDNGILIPTVTGLLLIGKEEKIKEYIPTAKSTFQVLEGTNVRKNEEYGKSLLAMLEWLETNFNAWNPEHEIEDGLTISNPGESGGTRKTVNPPYGCIHTDDYFLSIFKLAGSKSTADSRFSGARGCSHLDGTK